MGHKLVGKTNSGGPPRERPSQLYTSCWGLTPHWRARDVPQRPCTILLDSAGADENPLPASRYPAVTPGGAFIRGRRRARQTDRHGRRPGCVRGMRPVSVAPHAGRGPRLGTTVWNIHPSRLCAPTRSRRMPQFDVLSDTMSLSSMSLIELLLFLLRN